MGASQPPAGANPPRAPKRGGPGTPMAHRGRGQLAPPSPVPWQGHRGLPLECPPQEGPHLYRDLPGDFSRHLQDALFPPWIIGQGSMSAWEARIVGADLAREWRRWCAATRAPETPALRYAAILLCFGLSLSQCWRADVHKTPRGKPVQAWLCAMQCGTITQLPQCVRILKVCPPCSNGLKDT